MGQGFGDGCGVVETKHGATGFLFGYLPARLLRSKIDPITYLIPRLILHGTFILEANQFVNLDLYYKIAILILTLDL